MSDHGVRFTSPDIQPTDAQLIALGSLATRWRGVEVSKATSFDALPAGYLTIVLDPDGVPVYGGVAPDGSIST